MSGHYSPIQSWQATNQRPPCSISDASYQGEGILRLTRREHEILHLLASRQTNQEIADLLSISVRTVECHVQGILHKLGAPNRRAAVALSQTRPAIVHYQNRNA